MNTREVAKDLEFAIDVTEPREVILRRFQDILEAAPRAAGDVPQEPHRCSGCGHRWEGPLKGAELCGDCWRNGQSAIFAGAIRGREAPGWQPIATAPKDGTEVWLTDGHWKRSGWWARRREVWSVDTVVSNLPPPTHWCPLPAAPRPEEAPEK